jgi:hypothetical protein
VQINGGAVSGWAGPPAWLTQPALFALSAGILLVALIYLPRGARLDARTGG